MCFAFVCAAQVTQAKAGDCVGISLRGVSAREARRGMVLLPPFPSGAKALVQVRALLLQRRAPPGQRQPQNCS